MQEQRTRQREVRKFDTTTQVALLVYTKVEATEQVGKFHTGSSFHDHAENPAKESADPPATNHQNSMKESTLTGHPPPPASWFKSTVDEHQEFHIRMVAHAASVVRCWPRPQELMTMQG